MVEATRAFVQCWRGSCDEVVSKLRERFPVKAVQKSKVVPNFVMIEFEGLVEGVEESLRDLGIEDFKVMRVRV